MKGVDFEIALVECLLIFLYLSQNQSLGRDHLHEEWVDTMDERAVYVYFRGCE
jgi:hypothetical protein